MRIFSLILISLFVAGCASSSIKTNNQLALQDSNIKSVKEIVIIPVKITVKESGIGSLEKLPEKSRIASQVVQEELTKVLNELNGIRTINYKASNEEQVEMLDESIGLYQRVAGAAQFVNYAGEAWSHKTGNGSDYTLGKQINFIKEQTGVDKAIFVYGEDIVTSGGKKALGALALLAGIGVNPGGIAVLHLGIVDLNNGTLLWTNTIINQTMSLNKPLSVHKAILETLESSPFVASK